MDQDRKASHSRQWRLHQERLLERIARGEAAASVLEALCISIEQVLGSGIRCAVHLPDAEGTRIVQVIAPSFGGYFNRRGGVTIAPTSGTSAAAGYLRRRVVLGHIRDETLVVDGGGAEWRELGISSVCATPVLLRDTLLGVVSIYYAQPGDTSSENLRVVEWAVRIAGIALGHARTVSDLVSSEQKYRSFLDNLHDGVFVAQDNHIVYANSAMTALMGCGMADLVHTDFYSLIHPADADRLREFDAQRDRGERVPRECVVRVRRPDAELRVMRISHSMIVWNDAAALLSMLTDITERERAQQEVQRLNIELEHRIDERTRELTAVNRELEAFSYSVSHDLRAPVRAINGFSSILLSKHAAVLDADARLNLERVRSAGLRMNEMIDGLLALARTALATPRFECVGMSALARSVLEKLHEVHPERTVRYDVAEDVAAWGDRRLLGSVFENLLGNAWKFTGKVAQSRIAFGAKMLDGECVYYVRDNGAGFDMQYAGKLFGVFQRLHRTEEFEGTGVGLATVQRIISCHGGRIWAKSEKGCGATFFFTLGQPPIPKAKGSGASAGSNEIPATATPRFGAAVVPVSA